MSSSPRRRARAALAALVTTGLIGAALVAAAPADAAGRRVSVPAARPAWATAAADSGALDAATDVHVQIALELPDEAAARDFATAVSTPGSPQYRQHLTPDEWIARFAPTQASVDAIASAVQAAGLTVDSVPKSRLFVTLSGSAGDVDAFFATRLHAFDVDGETRVAATGTATLPGAAGRSVAAVTFQHPRVEHGPQAAAKAKAKDSPCSAYWKQHAVAIPKTYGQRSASTPLCGYTAAQLRKLLGLSASSPTGAGQTVAVIDAFGSPTIRRDLATYSTRNGLPAAAYREILPEDAGTGSAGCTPEGWQVEQTLDLEAVHAVAPRASLLYVGAADCGAGFDSAMSTVLDDGLASIVSNSWGSTALDTVAGTDLVDDATRQSIVVNLHQHLQAAGQGVGLYFASGDTGDDSEQVGSPAVDFPASSPFVTAVGGTASGLDRRGKRVFSVAWGENVTVREGRRWSPSLPGLFNGGAGGGASTLFSAPAYQRGVVPTSLSHGRRTSTDVAALAASTTGFEIGVRQIGTSRYAETAVGGTSLATPIVAAQVALAQQQSGRRLGFLNPALYGLAKRSPSAIRDVRDGPVRRAVAARSGGDLYLITIDRDSSLKARKGYDLPTGLGELTPASLKALGRL